MEFGRQDLNNDPLDKYLSEIGKVKLLTRSEEKILFRTLDQLNRMLLENLFCLFCVRVHAVEYLRKELRERINKEKKINEDNPVDIYGPSAKKIKSLLAKLKGLNNTISGANADIGRLYLNAHTKAKVIIPLDISKEWVKESADNKVSLILNELTQVRNRIIEANLRLVTYFAKRYVNRGLDLPELIQEGNIGLMKAVEKFNYRRPNRFSTMTSSWINQSIERALINNVGTIRIPVHRVVQNRKIARAKRTLQREDSKEFSDEEIAKHLNMSLETVQNSTHLIPQPGSLNEPVNSKPNSSELIDTISGSTDEIPESKLEAKEKKKIVGGLLSKLDKRKADILKLRTGIDCSHNHTLEEVGEKHGITRERVRQIEQVALRELKRLLSKKGREFLYDLGYSDYKFNGDKADSQDSIAAHTRNNDTCLKRKGRKGRKGRLLVKSDGGDSRFYTAEELQNIFRKYQTKLRPREKTILMKRCGFENGEIVTQQVIADQFSISVSYVGQIEKATWLKLKKLYEVEKKKNNTEIQKAD